MLVKQTVRPVANNLNCIISHQTNAIGENRAAKQCQQELGSVACVLGPKMACCYMRRLFLLTSAPQGIFVLSILFSQHYYPMNCQIQVNKELPINVTHCITEKSVENLICPLPVMVGYDGRQSSDTYSVAHQVNFLTQEVFHPKI